MAIYEYEGMVPVIAAGTFVHEHATVIGNVTIGAGCYIAASAVLRGDWGKVTVGEKSNIQDGCLLHTLPGEEVFLGPECHIAHGAIVHGARLARHVVVGMNAVILDFAELADNCVVGSNSLVPARMKIDAATLVAGVPAKVKRELSEAELQQWMAATRFYQELAPKCLSSLRRVS